MYGDVFAPAVHQHCTAGSAMHTLIEARGHCSWPQPIEMKDYFAEREGVGSNCSNYGRVGRISWRVGTKSRRVGTKSSPRDPFGAL